MLLARGLEFGFVEKVGLEELIVSEREKRVLRGRTHFFKQRVLSRHFEESTQWREFAHVVPLGLYADLLDRVHRRRALLSVQGR